MYLQQGEKPQFKNYLYQSIALLYPLHRGCQSMTSKTLVTPPQIGVHFALALCT
jgi:hypothetical protein